MLQQVVYISSATKMFEADELERLLAWARKRNMRSDVTGALLQDGCWFLQVLEGAADDVQRTLARIKRDPRHSGLTVVQQRSIERRDFNDWSMAFGHGDGDALERMRDGQRLDRDFVPLLVKRLSLPVSQPSAERGSLRGAPSRVPL